MRAKRTLFLNLALLIVSFATVRSVAQIPCSPVLTPPATLNVNWPQFQFDAKRSGCNPYEHILSTTTVGNLTLGWQYATPYPVHGGSQAVVNGVLYSDSYAVKTSTGELLWDNGVVAGSAPAVVNGVEYIGGAVPDVNLHAINTSDGTIRWSFPTGSQITSSPTVVNGVVYFGSWDSFVYAVNAATGTLVWKHATGGSVESSPAVTNGVVYVGSDDKNMYALDAGTGTILWQFAASGRVADAPSVANGMVYFGACFPDVNFYAVNAATGVLAWKSPLGSFGANENSPAVADGVVYIPDENSEVFAFNAATGANLWQYSTGENIQSSPVIANGLLYLGSQSHVVALNAATGSNLWSASGNTLGASLTVVNGTVYFTSEVPGNPNPTGVIWAFHLPGK